MGKLLNLLLLVLLLLFFVGLFFGLYKAVRFLNSHQPITDQTEQVVSDKEIREDTIPDNQEKHLDIEEMSDEEILRHLDEILADDEDIEPDDSIALEMPPKISQKSVDHTTSPRQSIKPTKPSKTKQSAYYVIVGSFKEKINAKIELKKMKSYGYNNARILNFTTKGYTTVILDNYSSKTKARQVAKYLNTKYKREAYVRKRK